MENEEKYVRTQEDVNVSIKLANLEEGELKNISQVLRPSSDSHSTYKLLELNDNLLKVLTEGSCLSFKGAENDDAVLCTKDRTYKIKEAETSNTLLVIPNLKLANDIKDVCKNPENRIIEEKIVLGQFNTYYEVTESKPKFGNLKKLLKPSAFNGLEFEKHLKPETLFDWERLQRHVPASEDELREALPTYSIVNINGYYRLISFESESRALTLMLEFMDENSWEIDEVDKEMTYNALQEFIPRPIFDLVFDKYTEPSEKVNDNGTTLYRYKEAKVCNFLAQVLLAASPTNEYVHFMESWTLGVPEKLKPKDEYLAGVALIRWNPQKQKKEIVSFPESTLSENIVQRLKELFQVKDKWTVDEITPYISRCATRTADANALLTKYARSMTINGVKYYCSKHGK